VSLRAGGTSGHSLEGGRDLGGRTSLVRLGAVGGGVNDGDGGSRRSNSRRLEGAGGSGLAGHDSGESVGDGGDGNGGLGVSGGHSRDGTGLSGGADVGALDDGGGDDLLGVTGRAVDDRGSTACHGVDVGGGQSAGDIASGTVASGRGKGDGGSLGGDGLGSRALSGSLLTNGVSIGAGGLGDSVGVRSGSIGSLRTLGGLGAASRSSSKRDDVGGGLGSAAGRALEESTNRAAVVLANLGFGSSGEGDGKSGSEADVEDIANLDVKVNSKTKSESNHLVDRDSTVVSGDEGSSVLEEADPDGNLGTSLNLKDRDIKVGLKVDLSSETKAKLDSNLSRKVDISSNTNGESLGDKAIKGNINNLFGQERNLNESLLAESKVDTSRKVNSSINSDNKVKSKSSTGLGLKKTGDLEVKSGRSEEFN
jgi:hypothetical protein